MNTVGEPSFVGDNAHESPNFHDLKGIKIAICCLFEDAHPVFSRSPTVSGPFLNDRRLPREIATILLKLRSPATKYPVYRRGIKAKVSDNVG